MDRERPDNPIMKVRWKLTFRIVDSERIEGSEELGQLNGFLKKEVWSKLAGDEE